MGCALLIMMLNVVMMHVGSYLSNNLQFAHILKCKSVFSMLPREDCNGTVSCVLWKVAHGLASRY